VNKLWPLGLLILSLCASVPARAGEPDLIPLPELRQKTLLNDFRAIQLPAGVDGFGLDLAIAHGAVFDPPGKEGCAFLTGRYVAHELRSAIRETCETPPDHPDPVRLELSVEFDFTRFGLAGPADKLIPVGQAIMAVLNRLEFDETRFQQVKEQVFLEAARTEDTPEVLALREWRRLQYEPAPYSNDPRGTTASLNSIELKDLIRFYRRCYLPNRSLLVLQSGIAEPDFKRFVTRHFGPWTKQEAPEYTLVQARKRSPADPRTRCLRNPSSTGSCLWFGWDCLRRKDEDFEAALLLAALLRTRLETLLDGRPGYRAAVHPAGLMLGGSFGISISGPPEFDLQLAGQLQQILQEIAQGRFSLAEFQQVQARHLAERRQALSGSQLGTEILEAELYRLGSRYLKLTARRTDGIIKEDLSFVASEHLSWPKVRVVVVSPGNLSAELLPDPLRPAVDAAP